MVEHVLECDDEVSVVIFFVYRAGKGGYGVWAPTVGALWGVGAAEV